MANKGIIFVVAIYICGTSCFVFFYESCMGGNLLIVHFYLKYKWNVDMNPLY